VSDSEPEVPEPNLVRLFYHWIQIQLHASRHESVATRDIDCLLCLHIHLMICFVVVVRFILQTLDAQSIALLLREMGLWKKLTLSWRWK
jgi:hypothetical protein